MTSLFEIDLLAWATSVVGEEIRAVTPIPSNEINAVFRLTCDGKTLFLKSGPNLEREYHRLEWLQGRLAAPRPMSFHAFPTKDAFLMSAVEGEGLTRSAAPQATPNGGIPAQVIITRLTAALKAVHATDTAEWPFDRKEGGTVLVHGDACLPNFIFHGDYLSGCIDVGGMTVADPEIDLAAAVWSLQYNLGPGHGLPFLREYGLQNATEEDVERLRLMYE